MSSHVDSDGNVMMVDISDKPDAARVAMAEGRILVSPMVLDTIRHRRAAKGDVLTVAQLAGITAAKRTADLIPLCHPLALAHCKILLEQEESGIRAECTVKTRNGTGVEMEALTGVSVALLTIYDMCKSMDKSMTIEGIRLLKKSGGKSGDFERT